MNAPVRHTPDFDALLPEDLSAQRIGECLAKINRFIGRTDRPYSVATHSLVVMRLVSESARPAALLHDAHEAFIGDIATPALEYIASQSVPMGSGIVHNCVRQAKAKLDRQIEAAWGVSFHAHRDEVHAADQLALAAEMYVYFAAPLPADLSGRQSDIAIHTVREFAQDSWGLDAARWIRAARRLADAGHLTLPTPT